MSSSPLGCDFVTSLITLHENVQGQKGEMSLKVEILKYHSRNFELSGSLRRKAQFSIPLGIAFCFKFLNGVCT